MEATAIVKEAEPELLKLDEHLTLIKASGHQSLKHILSIKYWLRVWDNALDKGCAGTVATQRMIRFLATPTFSDRKCWKCLAQVGPDLTCAEHLLRCQSLSNYSIEQLCKATQNFEDLLFVFSKVILNIL